ncbi:MAG: hypothetical protein DI535_14070 [Citrobacter freundii]|nr:MAG: hypothetical protein DI535_14070 [Citrobacter freundii]
MRTSKKIALLVIVFIATVWFVMAQRDNSGWAGELPDAAAELRRVVARQQEADSLLVEGDIRLYDQKNPDALLESISFSLYRKGTSFYSSFGPLLIVGDDRWMIQVDSLSQRIVVQEIDPVTQAAIMSPKTSLQMLEQVWQDTAVFKVEMKISEKNRLRTIELVNERNPEVRSASLTYDPITARILSAEIRWRKDQSEADENGIWISRINYKNKPGFVMDLKAVVNSIVEIKDGQLIPAPAYQNYELMKADNNAGMKNAE